VISNPFEQFYTQDVTVLSIKIDDYSGDSVNTILGAFKADVQPYSTGRAHEEYGLVANQYGLTSECQKRMYCPDNECINEGNYVEVQNTRFCIIYAEHWESYAVALLQKVNL
jgi:hypothetical protein